jgi:hypothetical protein
LSATESNSASLKRAEKAESALRRTTLLGLWSRRSRVRVPSLTPSKPLGIVTTVSRVWLFGRRRGPKRALQARRACANADVSDAQFRAIGVVEVLGAIGLIVPAAFVSPLLTPLAAVGLVLTMVGAIRTHVRYAEGDRLAVPIVVLALALFVVVEGFGTYGA